MSTSWKSWKPCHSTRNPSDVLRYSLVVILVGAAIFLTYRRPVLEEVPYIFFLAAVTMTALFAGLGPGFLATALAALSIRLLFIEPRFYLYHYGNLPDMERLCWFVLAALIV